MYTTISSGDKYKLNYRQQARKCREMRTVGVGSSKRQASAQRFGERKEGEPCGHLGEGLSHSEKQVQRPRGRSVLRRWNTRRPGVTGATQQGWEMGDLERPAEAPGWFVSHCALSWCCLVFVCLGHTQWSMWDLSSPIRHQTQVPCVDAWRPNHWTTREGSRVSYRCNRKPRDGDSKSSQT